jgi:hypothetical protein
MGFLQFAKPNRRKDGSLYWGLSDEYGAPIRGPLPPLLRSDELERVSDIVYEAHVGVFDTSQPDQTVDGRTYREVLEGIVCGWFRLSYRRHYVVHKKGEPPRVHVYIEWVEPYIEVDHDKASVFKGGSVARHG